MVARWYLELARKFPDIRCREYVVMPNHFHCILENTGTRKPQPEHDAGEQTATDELGEQHIPDILGEQHSADILGEQHSADILGEHIGSPLHTVVQWFKTMTTNEYILGVKNLGWQRFDGKLWQRNYWEHIVRNDFDYDRIAKYIVDNPAKWNSDKFNVVGLLRLLSP
jgi:REP element-mobilizing transposase RayT